MPSSRRSSGTGWLWTLLILAGLGVFGIVAIGLLVEQFRLPRGARMAGSLSHPNSDLREVLLESGTTRDKIAVVEISGVISGSPLDHQGNNLVSYLEEQLDRAGEDDLVKAVVLKIDSPGGEVMASDEIYKRILDFQEEYDKPVIASMGTVAASGGYYVAAPCRWIVANDLTITGSIGVIMHTYNWRGLMDRVGVRPLVFKSGELKDMLSPDKPEDEITDEERRIVQDLVDETFDRFKAVVEEGRRLAESRNQDNAGDEVDRGRALAGAWEDFADGRLLSGKEAWKLGMVDELGDFRAAVARALKLADIPDARLIQYLRPLSFGSLFRFLGQSEATRITLDLGIPLPTLRTGLYYLAPQLVR